MSVCACWDARRSLVPRRDETQRKRRKGKEKREGNSHCSDTSTTQQTDIKMVTLPSLRLTWLSSSCACSVCRRCGPLSVGRLGLSARRLVFSPSSPPSPSMCLFSHQLTSSQLTTIKIYRALRSASIYATYDETRHTSGGTKKHDTTQRRTSTEGTTGHDQTIRITSPTGDTRHG